MASIQSPGESTLAAPKAKRIILRYCQILNAEIEFVISRNVQPESTATTRIIKTIHPFQVSARTQARLGSTNVKG